MATIATQTDIWCNIWYGRCGIQSSQQGRQKLWLSQMLRCPYERGRNPQCSRLSCCLSPEFASRPLRFKGIFVIRGRDWKFPWRAPWEPHRSEPFLFLTHEAVCLSDSCFWDAEPWELIQRLCSLSLIQNMCPSTGVSRMDLCKSCILALHMTSLERWLWNLSLLVGRTYFHLSSLTTITIVTTDASIQQCLSKCDVNVADKWFLNSAVANVCYVEMRCEAQFGRGFVDLKSVAGVIARSLSFGAKQDIHKKVKQKMTITLSGSLQSLRASLTTIDTESVWVL